jgi:PAS domain S-box-containing protein
MSTSSPPAELTIESMTELMRTFSVRVAELEARLEEGAREKRSWEHDRRLFELVADNVDDLIAVIDPHGRRVWNNGAYFEVLGYKPEEMVGGYSLMEVYPDDVTTVEEAFSATIRTGAGTQLEYRMRHKNGSWVTLESTARPVTDSKGKVEYLILVSRDISGKREQEEEKARGNRLEMVGVVVQGIAQEFNDIISGMRGYITAARQTIPRGHPAGESLQEAERVAQRANVVMQRLSYLTNKTEHPRENIVPAELLRAVASKTIRNSPARCEFTLSENLNAIPGDRESLWLVFESLLANAVEAMKTPGIIRVTGENTAIVPGVRDIPAGLTPGQYVRIDITDQGEGIGESNRMRIFDPYFTTKKNAVGLGLTTALSIVKRAGGNILVKSTLNVGSTFSVYLPANASKSTGGSQPAASAPVVSTRPQGRRTALVMDDEALVCEFASAALEHLGYKVTTVSDGAQAITAYTKALTENVPHDLVFLDLDVKRGVGGLEAFRNLIKLDPRINVILASGRTDEPMVQSPGEYGIKGALLKPYSIKKVREVIERVLGVTA